MGIASLVINGIACLAGVVSCVYAFIIHRDVDTIKEKVWIDEKTETLHLENLNK